MAEVGLHCPKCHAGMASFQRSGIMVEQCATCRGVFLGEAELVRLLGSGTPAPAAALNGHHRQAYEGRHRRG